MTSHEALTPAEHHTVARLQAAISAIGGRSAVFRADQLYTKDDLLQGRTWCDAVRQRLPETPTHAVLVGKSGHHFFTGAGLLSQHVEVFAEANVENIGIARRLEIDDYRTARGAALIERIAVAVRNNDADSPVCAPTISLEDDFKTKLEASESRHLPDWHEESVLDADRPRFDLFFSVAPIESRNDGARPQRIRAMSQAFDDPEVPLVRMTSNSNLLHRRLRGATALTKSGAKPRWGYGENSTAPMPIESREALASGLNDLRQAGLRFAWYVRDFHWLDPDSTVSQERDDLAQMRDAGLAEFAAMRQVSDVLYAPSIKAAKRFDELLRKYNASAGFDWKALPPGIDPSNCLAGLNPHSSQNADLHIIYSGGLGGVYDIGTAMKALSQWGKKWELQVIVRPEDENAARKLTSAMPSRRVKISSGEFASVSVPNGKTIGLALLDSDYGLASFPLKVMSYLEKRIPVLVYRGSSPASLVQSYGAGLIADRESESVVSALESHLDISGESQEVNWLRLHRQESWASRAEEVRRHLHSLEYG
ncbi:glycosyltransferase [Brevibacterium casei]|uniref:glycosyltransferase n=1 Tax=Brevibacterium casei TaxID=33889 RepID=UPI00167CCE60|nr:glycosyltransferase [Brevibacterium casei]